MPSPVKTGLIALQAAETIPNTQMEATREIVMSTAVELAGFVLGFAAAFLPLPFPVGPCWERQVRERPSRGASVPGLPRVLFSSLCRFG